MKRNLLFLAATFLSFAAFSQQMIPNSGLETWATDNDLDSWTETNSQIVVFKESTIVHSGSFAAKVVAPADLRGDIYQKVAVTPGHTYTLSMWYYVAAGDGTDARIWSSWKTADDAAWLTDNEDVLKGPGGTAVYFVPEQMGVWYNYTTTVTAPANAGLFNFEVRTYKNSTVYWDDLSFIDNAGAALESVNSNFKVYPNPVQSELNITSDEMMSNVKIVNVIGQTVVAKNVNAKQTTVNTASLKNGVYFVRVQDNNGNTSVSKILKN